MKIVYPGSFDPITLGHLDIIVRASELYEEVVVLLAINSSKKTTFTLEERKAMLERVLEDEGILNARVETTDTLVVRYCKENNIKLLIRGLRALSDFEYEMSIESANKAMEPDVESVFLMTRKDYSFLSSSIVKEIAKYDGDISKLVPSCVAEEIREKLFLCMK